MFRTQYTANGRFGFCTIQINFGLCTIQVNEKKKEIQAKGKKMKTKNVILFLDLLNMLHQPSVSFLTMMTPVEKLPLQLPQLYKAAVARFRPTEKLHSTLSSYFFPYNMYHFPPHVSVYFWKRGHICQECLQEPSMRAKVTSSMQRSFRLEIFRKAFFSLLHIFLLLWKENATC